MDWRRLLVGACAVAVASAVIAEPHPRVLHVRRQEEQLPPYLRSGALYNPRLRQALHYSSALHKGERQVFTSEAENIPRAEIFTVLTHAGFIPRQGRQVQSYESRPRNSHKTSATPFPFPFNQGGNHLQFL